MTPTLIALALQLALPSLPFTGHHPADEQRTHKRIGSWTLTVMHDRFAAETKCRLTTQGMNYWREAIVVRLPQSTDTSDAAYRVDDGTPRPASEDAMELAHQGFPLHHDDLANPSGGFVVVPAHLVTGANRLSVQARPGGRVWSFKLSGLDTALEAARAAGCGPAAFR
jgi:hypothetical protein